MKFTLAYNVDKSGWADATLQCDGITHTINSISYVSDAFTELSEAVLDLLNGSTEICCTVDHEPGLRRSYSKHYR